MDKVNGFTSALSEADAEYAGIVEAFLREARAEGSEVLGARRGWLAVLAALIGCQGVEAFRAAVPAALAEGVTGIEVREVVYQATDYVGYGRALPFVLAAGKALEACGDHGDGPFRSKATPETRLEMGNACQVEIFGEDMRKSWETCPAERATVNRWLAANCFGDYYTRDGLSLADRELVTFCYLVAQGGCDPQATAHAGGNIRMGNGADVLYAAVHRMLPFIGYPRSLNALACIDAAAKSC